MSAKMVVIVLEGNQTVQSALLVMLVHQKQMILKYHVIQEVTL